MIRRRSLLFSVTSVKGIGEEPFRRSDLNVVETHFLLTQLRSSSNRRERWRPRTATGFSPYLFSSYGSFIRLEHDDRVSDDFGQQSPTDSLR